MCSEADPIDEGPHAATPDVDDIGVEELRRLLTISQDTVVRTAADLDNLQKRFQRELAKGREAERRRVLTAWAESIDDLERALAYVPETEDAAAGITDGVQTIVTKAVRTVDGLGYPRFGSPGDPFDPAVHHVISTVPAGPAVPDGVVIAVAKPGYGSAEALLRPASVVVGASAE